MVRVGMVVLACVSVGACESAKKAETQRQPPTPTVKQRTPPVTGPARRVADRILVDLGKLLPKMTFTSIDCSPNDKPVLGGTMMCVVKHAGGNADRHVQVTYTDKDGGFMWGRAHRASSFDQRLRGFLDKNWPVPIDRVTCPPLVVAYPKASTDCQVALVGGQVEQVVVRWKTQLGAFTAHRTSDHVALEKKIVDTLRKRGNAVKSVTCPRRVPLTKQRYSCTAQLASGANMHISVVSEKGNATIGIPVNTEKNLKK